MSCASTETEPAPTCTCSAETPKRSAMRARRIAAEPSG
jgi:hypothetical protein